MVRLPRSLPWAFALSVFVTSCSSDDESGASAQIRRFCQDLFASPAFSCCSPQDRQDRQIATRTHYPSVAACTDQLVQASTGRRFFDGEAAAACLAHFASQSCGRTPTALSHVEEEKAGCARVIGGQQAEGQPCETHEDCKIGLVCPPLKETGLSYCSAPGAANQSCIGTVPATAIDHPGCQPGLVCTLVGENASDCPSPPCLDYRCVPLSEEGEPCSALECAPGLACRAGLCSREGPSPAGGSCRLPEHCADGLFCEPTTGQCAPRKDAGTQCRSGGSALLECKGICKESTDGSGASLCASYCSSG